MTDNEFEVQYNGEPFVKVPVALVRKAKELTRVDAKTKVLVPVGEHCIAVFAALATFAHRKTGQAYPSIATLAELLGISQRMVRYAVEALKAEGFITMQRRARKPALYTLQVYATVTHERHTCATNERHTCATNKTRAQAQPQAQVPTTELESVELEKEEQEEKAPLLSAPRKNGNGKAPKAVRGWDSLPEKYKRYVTMGFFECAGRAPNDEDRRIFAELYSLYGEEAHYVLTEPHIQKVPADELSHQCQQWLKETGGLFSHYAQKLENTFAGTGYDWHTEVPIYRQAQDYCPPDDWIWWDSAVATVTALVNNKLEHDSPAAYFLGCVQKRSQTDKAKKERYAKQGVCA